MALVVEDEWLVRMEMADALQETGWDVLEAGTGEAALLLIGQPMPIHLIITDIRLPGPVTGWDVADAFRKADQSVAIVYCSGNPRDPAREVAGSIFLSKPCRSDFLVETCWKLRPQQSA
jgi:CheY-like chemotaxis protein